MPDNSEPCPLCRSQQVDAFFKDKTRPYLQCRRCRLVFVPTQYHLSAAEEKAEYDLHENNPQDSGYRTFLSRLHDPLIERLKPHSHGLDFGCGPGPTLSLMLEEAGHSVEVFDKYYANNTGVWEKQYDFITATEVVEHLHKPGEELERLFGLLKPGGILGIMTKLVKDQEAFQTWHYKNDRTHICFFSQDTFRWLAQQWNAKVEFFGADVILIHKPANN